MAALAIFVAIAVCTIGQRGVLVDGSGGEVEYVAAILEHHAHQALPFVNASAHEAIQFMTENLDEYEQAAAQARGKGAQIIVFPEDAIYGVGLPSIAVYAEEIPLKSEMLSRKIVPCGDEAFNDRVVLQRLSCIAAKHGIAVVANMADRQSSHFYNTDVAFDTDGRLLTKYHKLHLFFEANFTPNDDPDPDSTFTTSFGVRFGLCTCYDILFSRPCFDYPTKLGVHDLVFPTAWMNAFPLLYSITVQQAFSKMTNSNVLAANMHFPAYRFTGSGIYGRGGDPKAVYISNESGKGQLLIARLRTHRAEPAPKIRQIPGHTNTQNRLGHKKHASHVVRDPDVEYTYKPLPKSETSFILCEGEFCCHVDYEIDIAEGEVFALGVFSGLKPRQPETFYFQSCAIVVCEGSAPSSCGTAPSEGNVRSTFRNLKVHAQFHPSVDSTRLYPIVFSSGFDLVNMTTAVDLHHVSDDNTWELNVVEPTKIFSAGLFGRPTHLP